MDALTHGALGQNGGYFADDIFKHIFFNEDVGICI